MASTTDFRMGLTFRIGHDIFEIVDFQHVKPGKGGAFVRTKLKNLKTKNVIGRTFRAGEEFEDAYVEERKVGFMYQEGSAYHFMDHQTYEQFTVDQSIIGEVAPFLKENMEIAFVVHEGRVMEARLPNFVELLVKETAPGLKGDTAKGGYKPAVLESGGTIQVPLFIDTGDVVRVDTRTGQYVARV